jgi:hypothetical protein
VADLLGFASFTRATICLVAKSNSKAFIADRFCQLCKLPMCIVNTGNRSTPYDARIPGMMTSVSSGDYQRSGSLPLGREPQGWHIQLPPKLHRANSVSICGSRMRAPAHKVSAWITRYSYGIYLTHMYALWTAFVVLNHPLWIRGVVLLTLSAGLPVLFYKALDCPMMKL